MFYKTLMAAVTSWIQKIARMIRKRIGDDPVLDVGNAKSSGLTSVQYTGVVDRGPSPLADYVIDDWAKLFAVT
jgi:flavodoxin